MSKDTMDKGLLKKLVQMGRNMIAEAYVAGRNDLSRGLFGKLGLTDVKFSVEAEAPAVKVPTRKRRKPPSKQEAARRVKQGKYMGMMRRMPVKVRQQAKALQKKFGLDRAIAFLSKSKTS